MKQIFLNSSMNFLSKYKEYSDDEKESLLYGLEGLYLTITKMIIIISLAVIFNIFMEVVVSLVFFNIIRYFGFGFHAEKSWQCLIISTIQFVFLPLLIFNLQFSLLVKIIICGISLLMYLFYAPMDTIKRPFKNKKKRLRRKGLTLLVGIIYTVMIFTFNNDFLVSSLICSMIVQAIVVCPLLYIVMGQSYNNFKSIMEEERI